MKYQSATSISDFKRCSVLYYLRHIQRLRPIETPEPLRQGTTWHKCLEILKRTPSDGQTPRDVLIAHMNEAYKEKPVSLEWAEWEVEQTILLYGALAWDWYWQDDDCETIACEVPFKRDLTGAYGRRGKIDRIIRRGSQLFIGEYKTTAQAIDTGSAYWDRFRRDPQITFYILEARQAQIDSRLEPAKPLISGVLYDVFHKPQIRPKKLTQADSKKFLEDGEYFGGQFLQKTANPVPGVWDGKDLGLLVNDVKAEVFPGKKEGTFAIRETPEMFGARLMHEFQTEPEKYFVRREVSRAYFELQQADAEYTKLARLVNVMEQRDFWYRNEDHCSSFGQCSFCPICDYNIDVTKEIPDGFKRI